MSFPDLRGFPVTFMNGQESWVSRDHTGFILKVEQLRDDYRLQIAFPMAAPPTWLRNAPMTPRGEVDVAVSAEGRVWNQRFALSNMRHDNSRATLFGESTGGKSPYWT